MNAKIEFKLPEEQEDFETAVNAYKYKQLVIEIDYLIREKIKHGEYQRETFEQLQAVRDFIYEFAINEKIDVV
jgi:hypothetical protein